MSQSMIFASTTWRQPDQEMCNEYICSYLTQYTKKRWWQRKKYLLREAKRWARTYNELERRMALKEQLTHHFEYRLK